MSNSNGSLQRSALVMKILGWGLIAGLTGGLFLYPPGFLWGSHPASFPNIGPPHPESPLHALHPYLFMILSIYVAYGILLIRGAKDPKANAALFDFGILSSLLHGVGHVRTGLHLPQRASPSWGGRSDCVRRGCDPLDLLPQSSSNGNLEGAMRTYDKQPLGA